MGITSIEWTDRTWNPVRGCSRVSEGCRNCYAERLAARFADVTKSRDGNFISAPFAGFVRIANGHPQWTGKVEIVEKHLQDPLGWKKPARVFVNSMSDLFHEALSDEAIDRIFAVMALCPQHTFQILTKRPERMLAYLTYEYRWAQIEGACNDLVGAEESPALAVPSPQPMPNVWLGVSVENQDAANDRYEPMKRISAMGWTTFCSYEPALEDVTFWGWSFLNWLIVGGESGPGARPFDIAWARHAVEQCKTAGVACFVKQLGARPYESLVDTYGRLLENRSFQLKDRKGGNPAEWPEDLRVRQFPREVAA